MEQNTKIGFEETLRINTYECDFNQSWKPAAMLQHFTEVAEINAINYGVGYEEFLANNLYWVLSRIKIQIIHYPRADELVIIRTWPKSIQQKLFYTRDFELLDTAGKRLIAATSAWLIVDANTRRLVPAQRANLGFPMFPECHALNETLEKLNLPIDGIERLTTTANYSSVDLLGHVNSSRYIEWICDSFDFSRHITQEIDWLQINYDHEVIPSEHVRILASPVGLDENFWALQGINQSNDTRAFEAAVHWREKEKVEQN